MVARLLAPAMILVDPGIDQPVGERRTEQQMIDAKAVIALPAARLIVPEGPDTARRMAAADRVGPAVAEQAEPGIARIGLHQRVGRHRARVDRKSVVEGKSVLVRVDLGGRRLIKKTNTYMMEKLPK